VSLVATGASAHAAPGAALDASVTGPFTGLSFFDLNAGCAFVLEEYDLTFTTGDRRQPGTVHIEGCVSETTPGVFAFESGSFSLVTSSGAALSGTVSGGLFPIDLTLTVTDGTRGLRRATGTIAVDGTGGPSGAVSGTLTGSLSRR
jgi:hypothetical protein